MSIRTLLYHDVFHGDDRDVSGFSGAAAGVYKISASDYDLHLGAIERRTTDRFGSVVEVLALGRAGDALLMTFDDGGASSLHIADRLEARGWIGHFFITTDRIGYRAFLSAGEIGELHQRGHIVGSHSHTHPERMWALTQAELVNEWATSSAILADHLGAPVTVASVPGGFYRRRVAEAAAEAGLCVLFTSEPSTRLTYVDGCAVLGRFNVDGRSSPTAAAGIAGGDRLPRLRQWAHWNAKKVAKTVAGNSYAAVRRRVLGS